MSQTPTQRLSCSPSTRLSSNTTGSSKEDEMQVDCNLCSIPTCKSEEVQVDWTFHLRDASQALKYIPSEEQSSLE